MGLMGLVGFLNLRVSRSNYTLIYDVSDFGKQRKELQGNVRTGDTDSI